jgi:hypothetical protein
MNHSFLHRGVCILLSVGIIAANGFSPVVVHSHVGGDAPHDHVASERAHSHSHPHHGHRHDHAHDGNGQFAAHGHSHARSEGIEGSIAHSHVNFFGLPLTFPGSGTGDTIAQRVNVVWLVDIASAEIGKTSDGLSAKLIMSQPVLLFSAEIGTGDLRLTYHPPHDNQSLLCDTARLERTGVRQI